MILLSDSVTTIMLLSFHPRLLTYQAVQQNLNHSGEHRDEDGCNTCMGWWNQSLVRANDVCILIDDSVTPDKISKQTGLNFSFLG